MDTAQWPQEIVVKPMEEIVTTMTTCSSKPAACSSIDQKNKVNNRPQKDQALNCPRCNSTNTKFCYYNNYSLSQPRYFCKTCRRYWTEGGSLRNIPVGGGSRKNKLRPSSSIRTKQLPRPAADDLVSQNPNNKLMMIHEDLNLGFPSQHDHFKTFNELIQVPNFDNNINNNNNKENMPSSSSSSSSQRLSALELLTAGITTSRGGLSSFMPMPIMPMNIADADPNSVYSSSGFSLDDDHLNKPSALSFSMDNGIGNSGGGFGSVQQESISAGRLLFPFEDLKQQVSRTSTTTTTDGQQINKDHNNSESAAAGGYWNGVIGGGTW